MRTVEHLETTCSEFLVCQMLTVYREIVDQVIQ